MLEAIQSRRSIRKFLPDAPVANDQLRQLMHAAMLAPSARNSRPWEFIAITNRETLAEIVRIAPNAHMCASAPAAIVLVAIPQTGLPEGYFPQDCGAAVQNILLEAASMGLGTCWCGVYPREARVAAINELLNITEPKLAFAIIAVGVSDEAPEARGFFEESKVTFIE
jgi:nitroreductase